jgi:hypothetical protein
MSTIDESGQGLCFHLERKIPFIARVSSGEFEGDFLRGMFFKPAGRGNHLPGGSNDVLLLDVAQATNGNGVGREYDSTYHLSADLIDRDLLKNLEKLQLDFSPSGTYEVIAAAMFDSVAAPRSIRTAGGSRDCSC